MEREHKASVVSRLILLLLWVLFPLLNVSLCELKDPPMPYLCRRYGRCLREVRTNSTANGRGLTSIRPYQRGIHGIIRQMRSSRGLKQPPHGRRVLSNRMLSFDHRWKFHYPRFPTYQYPDYGEDLYPEDPMAAYYADDPPGPVYYTDEASHHFRGGHQNLLKLQRHFQSLIHSDMEGEENANGEGMSVKEDPVSPIFEYENSTSVLDSEPDPNRQRKGQRQLFEMDSRANNTSGGGGGDGDSGKIILGMPQLAFILLMVIFGLIYLFVMSLLCASLCIMLCGPRPKPPTPCPDIGCPDPIWVRVRPINDTLKDMARSMPQPKKRERKKEEGPKIHVFLLDDNTVCNTTC